MLRRLGLQFASGSDKGDIGEVDADSILLQFPSELAYGLKEWQALYVADGTTDFSDDEVILARVAQCPHVAFDFVGDMRDDLDGAAEVSATAFTLHDVLVDAASGDVVGACGLDASEAFVVSEVKVSLLSVYGDIALTMLIRIECAGVDVDIWVILLDGDAVAA